LLTQKTGKIQFKDHLCANRWSLIEWFGFSLS